MGAVIIVLWIVVGILYVIQRCVSEATGSAIVAPFLVVLWLITPGYVLLKLTEAGFLFLATFIFVFLLFGIPGMLAYSLGGGTGVGLGMALLYTPLGVLATICNPPENPLDWVVLIVAVIACVFAWTHKDEWEAAAALEDRSVKKMPPDPEEEKRSQKIFFDVVMFSEANVPRRYTDMWLDNERFFELMADADAKAKKGGTEYPSGRDVCNAMRQVIREQKPTGNIGYDMRISLIRAHKQALLIENSRKQARRIPR